jgi:RNA polymerase sigma-70 factor (ECF subfamily)
VKAAILRPAANLPDEMSDEQLARGAVDGKQCFLILYERHIERMQRYVHSQVARPDDVEELVSTIFFRALNRIETYNASRGSFSAWLFAIARNAVHDYRRNAIGRRIVPLEGAEDVAEGSPGPEELTLQHERGARIRDSFHACTVPQREALALRYLGELRFAEVAIAMGKSEPAVKMLVQRGLEALRGELEAEEDV